MPTRNGSAFEFDKKGTCFCRLFNLVGCLGGLKDLTWYADILKTSKTAGSLNNESSFGSLFPKVEAVEKSFSTFIYMFWTNDSRIQIQIRQETACINLNQSEGFYCYRLCSSETGVCFSAPTSTSSLCVDSFVDDVFISWENFPQC